MRDLIRFRILLLACICLRLTAYGFRLYFAYGLQLMTFGCIPLAAFGLHSTPVAQSGDR